MLEVILKKDIDKLGDRGQVVKVADGYARNFLYPQKLAIPADKGSLKQLAEMRAAAQREAVRLRGDAQKQAAALEGVVVRVTARAGREDQLFGSVTNRHIAAELAEQGLAIDRHRIDLKTPLRVVGDYEVPIRFYKDVEATVKVEVRAEGREDEPPAAVEAAESQAAESEAAQSASVETADAESAEAAQSEPAEAAEAAEVETAEPADNEPVDAVEAETAEPADNEPVEAVEAETAEPADNEPVEAVEAETAEPAPVESAEAESAAAVAAEPAEAEAGAAESREDGAA